MYNIFKPHIARKKALYTIRKFSPFYMGWVYFDSNDGVWSSVRFLGAMFNTYQEAERQWALWQVKKDLDKLDPPKWRFYKEL